MFYPPTIREDATPSSEVQDAPEGVEVASPSAAHETISPQVPAEGSGPSGTAEADESQDPARPKEAAGPLNGGPFPHTEGPVIAAESLQLVPLAEGSKDPEASPAQPSLEGIKDESPA